MASGSDKIPLLGDIPIAGALFRYDSRQRTKTNLMIFIKPTVLRTTSDGRAITSERYDYLRGEQDRQAPPERLFWNDPTQPVMPREGVMPGTPGAAVTPPLMGDAPKPPPGETPSVPPPKP
jgi:general secretion pathway protein D